MIQLGGKTWFTAAEIADLALSGLPKVKRKVNERAEAENWALRVDSSGMPLARPRQARGGGLEYHVSLLPAASRADLVKRGIAMVAANDTDPAVAEAKSGQLWSWLEGQTDKVKAEANRRLTVVCHVDAFTEAGMTRSAAVAAAAQMCKVSPSTLWNWLKLIDGVAAIDRLPHLAPRRQGGGAEAEVDAGAWQFLKSDYLRPEQPTFSSCYWRMVREYAEPRGIAVPCQRTFQRKLERDIDPRLVLAMRKGREVLKHMIPAQQRTVAHLHAMEMVNIDGHKFDVFVDFGKDANGKSIVERPIMVAIQDIYSRKLLAWRIGDTESALLTRLAFADLFRRYGVPKRCLMDNGRAFASKWISGGTTSRFRFKIREDEPLGLLPALGIGISWALPYSGQSKPIERSFRDLADYISRDPRCAGAYTGNHVDNKPENYRSKAVPLADFLELVERGIAFHNSRGNRSSGAARGRSLDDAFAESFATAQIGKATQEHLRQALLTGEQLRADRKSGHIVIADNRYWSPELSLHSGKLLTVRFDPDDLSLPIHVYDQQGLYLCSADRWEASRFDDMGAAKRSAKLRGEIRKAVKRERELQQLLTAEQLVEQMRGAGQEPVIPEPAVLRPERFRGQTAAALKPVSDAAQEPLQDQFMGQFSTALLRLVE